MCKDDGDGLGPVCHRDDCLYCSLTPLGRHDFSFMSPCTSEQNLVLGVAAAGLHLMGLEAALDAPDQDVARKRLLNLS